MKLYLTGEPCSQQRHCYYVQGRDTSFIMDCGYQRCYRGDELPHLTPGTDSLQPLSVPDPFA